MKYALILSCLMIAYAVALGLFSAWKKKNATEIEDKDLPIAGAYQKRRFMSPHEEEAFKKIKTVTDETGCYTFSKVRLLDLLEPIKGTQKYKTYFYKVQAKHVDFILLDSRLSVRCILELDDYSHDREDRKERDRFVDTALQSVGYQIIHARSITDEVQQQIRAILTA